MLTILNDLPQAKQGFINATAALYPGQWCYVSGYDSGDGTPEVLRSTTTTTGAPLHSVFPITQFPTDDENWEAMLDADTAYTIATGVRVLGLVGGGIEVEDSTLFAIVGTGVYHNGDGTCKPGMTLMVNPSGWLIKHDAGGATKVAIVTAIDATAQTVTYVTL